MINLDDMTTESGELFAWWNAHQHATKAQRAALFDGRTGKGTIRACKDLANYAANKATAMNCRASGDVARALGYEQICQRIYDGLPHYARW